MFDRHLPGVTTGGNKHAMLQWDCSSSTLWLLITCSPFCQCAFLHYAPLKGISNDIGTH